MYDINTSYPARIVSFDAITQTATVKLVIERFFSDLDNKYVVIPTEELVDVPCHFPRGGGYSITMPVKVGDECLVFFAQRGIDHWLYEGKEETGGLLGRPSPQHKRRYDRSNALALIGFSAGILESISTIADFNIDAIEIRNADRTQRISLDITSKDISIVTDTNLNATLGGDLTATCTNAIVTATTNIIIKATNIKIDGDLECTGKILDKNGIDHVVHKHDKGNYLDIESRPLKSGDSGVPK